MGRKRKKFASISHRVTLTSNLTPISKTIYIALRSFNPSYVSYSKLMTITGIGSRTTISHGIKQLKNYGALEAVRDSQRKAKVYSFPFESVLPEYRLVHKMDSEKTQELVKISQKTNTKEIKIHVLKEQKNNSTKFDVKQKIIVKKDE